MMIDREGLIKKVEGVRMSELQAGTNERFIARRFNSCLDDLLTHLRGNE